MLLATFHRTADSRRDAPTPMIAPVIVCVVDTGTPSQVAPNSVIAPPVSAQKPCAGVSRVIFDPIVWTIRHPPASVPSAIAAWHESTTHNGMRSEEHTSEPQSLMRNSYAVFCL